MNLKKQFGRRAIRVIAPFALSSISFALDVYAHPIADQTEQHIVVTANRLPQAQHEVLADHIVITANDISRSGAQSVIELLSQQRGIEVARNGGLGTVSSVFIRGGNNAQNIVLVDGVRVTSLGSGGANWSTIPLSQVERIEIVFGPVASFYGADAVNGVIQIFTRTGTQEFKSNAYVMAGSAGTRAYNLGLSGSINPQWRYQLQAGQDQSDGISASKLGAGPYTYNPDRDGYKNQNFSGKIEWSASDELKFGAQFLQNRLNAQFDAGPSYDDRTEQKLRTLAFYAKTKFLKNWDSSLTVSNAKDLIFTDASYGADQSNSERRVIAWQNDVLLGKNTLQIIAEKSVEELSSSMTVLNKERDTRSLAAAYVLKEGAHQASVSVRHDRNSAYGNNRTGNLAYGYRLHDGLRVSAGWGTSFRAPTFNELYYPGFGNPSVQPEKGNNAELGLHLQNETLQASLVYYRNHITDLIVTAPVCPINPSNYKWGCAYNVNRASLAGWTMSAQSRWQDLVVKGNLDLQDPRDETTGKQLARRSRQHASASISYPVLGATVSSELKYTGERFDDVANKNRLSPYAVINLAINYPLMKNLELQARILNLGNRDYEWIKNYQTAGRQYFLGLQFKN